MGVQLVDENAAMADRINQLSRALEDARRPRLQTLPEQRYMVGGTQCIIPDHTADTPAPPVKRPRGMWAFITGEDQVPY